MHTCYSERACPKGNVSDKAPSANTFSFFCHADNLLCQKFSENEEICLICMDSKFDNGLIGCC
jgi:hypothetical protein